LRFVAIDGIEVLLRRLAALQLANANGHWQVASELKEVPASNFIGNHILAEAYKNASTCAKASKLGARSPPAMTNEPFSTTGLYYVLRTLSSPNA